MENQTNLELNAQAEDALRVSAKWSMFLAIIGFIGIALMVVLAFIMTTAMSSIPDDVYGNSPFGAMKGFISVIYFFMAAIYFVPVYYLFKYASGMKDALYARNSNMVSEALVFRNNDHRNDLIIYFRRYRNGNLFCFDGRIWWNVETVLLNKKNPFRTSKRIFCFAFK